MAGKNKNKNTSNQGTIAQNRRAKFDYEIIEVFEAGIALLGTEVKTLRAGTVKLDDAHAQASQCNGIEIVNLYIPEYKQAGRYFQHDTKRKRQLLLHKKQIKKIVGSIAKDGVTAIPLKLYFNEKGLVKLSLGLAKGKRTVDKRQTIKQREWNISKHRILKEFK